MKNLLSLLTAVFLMSFTLTSAAEPAKNVGGTWQGILDAGSVKLHVVFNISQNANGGFTASMDSPDQGARGIPVDSVTVVDTALTLEVKAVQGGFKGTLDASGNVADGVWSQGPNSLPLKLTKGAKSAVADNAEVLAPDDAAANREAAQKIVGTWNGALVTAMGTLHLRVAISKTSAGAATGTMDSLDQGANGIPLSAITLKEGKVRFEVRGVGGVYEGTLAGNGSAINGQWQQRGNSLPLELQKAKAE